MSACIVAGLGNPGAKYANTRHNLGFWAIDRLLAKHRAQPTEKFSAVFADVTLGEHRVFFLKPQTFMNLSGDSVGVAAGFYKIPPERVLVLTDDIDIPPGAVRIRPGGGSGGHNGLRSIAQVLGTDEFPRIRLGVGRSPIGTMAADVWVLAAIDAASRAVLDETAQWGADAAESWITDGVEKTMNRFNRKGTSP